MDAPMSVNVDVAPKMAAVLARKLEKQVVALGWPVGNVLGSEAELLAQFNVSRAVLREAVRIVEHTGTAHMRRGPGGGLVVTEPNRSAITTSMSVWFSYVGVTVGEIFDARIPLMLEVVRRAAQQRDVHAIEAILDRIADMDDSGDLDEEAFLDLDRRFIQLSDNPAVTLFADGISDLLASRLRGTRARLNPALTETDARVHLHGYGRLADSIMQGDEVGAPRRTARLLGAVRERMNDRPPRARRRPVQIDGGSPKLAEQIAFEMRDYIERAGWPVDTVLGSEAEMIDRYGVSRAVLREAVRILEHEGALRTKRGPGGGLIVAAPNADAIVHAAGLALEYARVSPAQLVDVRTALEVAAVHMSVARLTPEIAGGLTASIREERANGDRTVHLYQVHHEIAAAAGCRPLELFVRVLSELVTRQAQSDVTRGEDGKLTANTHHAHARVIEAIISGDAELAEKRLRRHLAAGIWLLH